MRPVHRIGDGTEPQPSDQLRGGRLLGPMERLLILGLGLSGQLTAAGLVIAAKGLIRFPELQSKRDERTTVEGVGIDEVTEYFLVGSFVSWLHRPGRAWPSHAEDVALPLRGEVGRRVAGEDGGGRSSPPPPRG